ncbi:MAG: hypothetical protein EXS63_02925 [Candidatus Omnitrophica bacterium]|nr:hypothetical protein [Candidatus Omnitrophota bacterium]
MKKRSRVSLQVQPLAGLAMTTLCGLSTTHKKKLQKLSSPAEKSYYLHESVRHSWTALDLKKAIKWNEFKKRGGLGLAPSLADAGRRGRALGSAHNTLQNSLRTASQNSR